MTSDEVWLRIYTSVVTGLSHKGLSYNPEPIISMIHSRAVNIANEGLKEFKKNFVCN